MDQSTNVKSQGRPIEINCTIDNIFPYPIIVYDCTEVVVDLF